jgi:membrane protein YdbS with pleckstrin-like domain
MVSFEDKDDISKPHPRMIHIWAIKVMLIPILLLLPLGFLGWVTGSLLVLRELAILLLVVGISYLWSYLYWLRYRWQLGEQDLRIWRGILFRKRVTIPYMRVQNVNVVHGPLLLLFGLSAVEVETAGERAYRSVWYSTEGYMPGVVEGEALADSITERLQRAKEGEGL